MQTELTPALVKERVEQHAAAITEFLREVIRTDSPSCREEKVVRLIAAEMERCDFDEVRIDSLGSVIGRVGDGPLRIMYDAHVDVVDVPDADKWEYPPFAAALVDGRIYGRGATDEKPAVSGMVYAARILKELGALEGITLYVVGSVMEEDCDGYPLLHIIEQEGIKPDYVILGEPTDLQVYRGHRGRMEMRIRTEGVSAHGAHVDRGINAVYLMAPIINEIERLNERLAVDPFLGKGTITVSSIEADTASLCSVPDGCNIYLDRRLTAGETRESALREVGELPGMERAELELLRYDAESWRGYRAEQEKYFPTWTLPEEHELVEAGLAAARLANPQASNTAGRWTFSTNGVATMGRLGIPTIGYAPGREELAHSRFEEVAVADLLTATAFYALLPQQLRQVLAGACTRM